MKWSLAYFDDQPQNIEVFKELLEEKFHVIGCSDVMAYPQILQENHLHAFLLDVHMPVMDGHTLFKKISEHPLYNGCPVIFISGDQSDENKIKSYNEGAVDFLPRDMCAEEIILRLTNKIKYYLQMSTSLELGSLSLDLQTMKATIVGEDLDLTLLELRMLNHILRESPGPGSLTRMGLIEKVWGDSSVKPGTINTHLTNLKSKIESWDYQIKVRDDNILVLKK